MIARWETRGKKHWYELYKSVYQGLTSYHYHGDGCGGNLGCCTRQEAINHMEYLVAIAKQIGGINMKRVF